MKLNRNIVRNLRAAIELSQEEPTYELEAILQGQTPGVISRSEYLRVVAGLEGLGLTKTIEPQRLDVRVEGERGLGNQRQSISGVDAISDFCKSGNITAAIEDGCVDIIRKSIIRRARELVNLPIQVKDQRFRVNVKSEDKLDADGDLVQNELRGWKSALKFFRLIRRVSFAQNNWRIDCSQVRMTPQRNGVPALGVDVLSSGVLNQPLRYEVEIEHVPREGADADAGRDLKDLVKLVTIIRRRITDNYFVSSAAAEQNVLRELRELTGVATFPGPMPVTLEPIHLDATSAGSIQTDYAVTEKADGMRKLLLFDGAGDGWFVDRSRTVFAAGLRGTPNSLVDGESIVTDGGELFYLIFDAYWVDGRPIWTKPLLGAKDSRLEGARTLVGSITGVHPVQSPRVFVKDFVAALKRGGIQGAAARVLSRTYPYRTDGLIQTPVSMAVYQEQAGRGAPPKFKAGTWRATMKWKPTQDQTIDFLVRRIKGAKKVAIDSVTGRRGFFTSFTLSVLDPLGGADPRETLLSGEFEPRDADKVVEFRPISPANPQASLMYVVDDAEGADPRTEEGELVEDQMIVECRYDVTAKPGWGWRPVRIRQDKTATQRSGRISGTLNSAEVADSIWQQIHLPITKELISTGEGIEEFLVEAENLHNDGQKYQNRNMRRDQLRTKNMSDFHNAFVKRRIIFQTFGKRGGGGGTFIDVACGKGGDLMKQKETGAQFVLGVDVVADNILNRGDGAVARYLKLRGNPRKQDRAPDCIFAIADGASDFASGDGPGDDLSRDILRKLFGTDAVTAGTPALLRKQGGVLKTGAAGVSCMFALHYFFKSAATAERFFANVGRCLKSGGLFAATLFDGGVVDRLLDESAGAVERRDPRTDEMIWRIERVAGEEAAGAGGAASKFGRQIRVYIDSINTHQVEYLVNQDHLLETAAKHGLRPLTTAEAGELGLPGTTELFQQTQGRLRAAGVRLPDLTEAERVQSFLNRWVFLVKE